MIVKLNLVILGEDKEYIQALSELFSKRYYKYFRISAVSTLKQLESIISSSKKVDILLVDSNIKEENENFKYIKNIIYLTESKAEQDIDNGILYKYQSITSIFNSIKRLYKKSNKDIEFDDNYDDAKLITIFSPIGGSGKTTIAIGLVDKLTSQGKKVLYINLEDIDSMEIFFDINTNKNNIASILYNINQEEILEDIVKETLNKDSRGNWYINPPNSMLDYSELVERELMATIKYLKSNTDFDYIVIDLGNNFNSALPSILQISNKGLLIANQNNIAIKKISKLLSQIETIEDVKIIVNKWIKEKRINITDTMVNIKDYLSHYIELDKRIENNDLNFELLSEQTQLSIGLDKLAEKILREEGIING